MILQNNIKFFLNASILILLFISILNISVLESFYTFVNLFCIFLIFITIIIYKNKLKPVYKNRLIFILIISIFILCSRVYLYNKEYIENYFYGSYVTSDSDNQKEVGGINQIDISKLNADQLLYLFQDQLKNNLDKNFLLTILNKLIFTAKAEATTTKPESFSLLGKAYQEAFIFGVDNSDQFVINSFAEYCKLMPKDSECYANFARFIGLDNTKRDTALDYAKKALSYAKNKDEIEVYTKLVEQYSK